MSSIGERHPDVVLLGPVRRRRPPDPPYVAFDRILRVIDTRHEEASVYTMWFVQEQPGPSVSKLSQHTFAGLVLAVYGGDIIADIYLSLDSRVQTTFNPIK